MKRILSILLSIVVLVCAMQPISFAFAFETEKMDICSHSEGYDKQVKKATLKSNGYIKYICKSCGQENKSKDYKIIVNCNDVWLKTVAYSYDGKAKTPTLYPNTISIDIIKASTGDYYKSGNPKQSNIKYTYEKNSKNIGKHYVTAKINGDYFSDTVKLSYKVYPGVSSSDRYIQAGKKFNINAKSNAKITYSSSDKKIATINSKGDVVAKKSGKTTITVKSNNLTKKVRVFVVKNAGIYVRKTPINKSAAYLFAIEAGVHKKGVKNYDLNSAIYVDGEDKYYSEKTGVKTEHIDIADFSINTKIDMNEYFVCVPGSAKKTWSSSNKNVCTIDKNGIVKAKKRGESIITLKATYKGKTYKKSVPVLVNKHSYLQGT